MAAGLILRFAQLARAQYEAVNAKLNIDWETGSGDWPIGMLSHAAGAADDGSFVVMEVWDSRESQGAFMQNRLGPAIAAAGIIATPQITWIDLYAYHTQEAQL